MDIINKIKSDLEKETGKSITVSHPSGSMRGYTQFKIKKSKEDRVPKFDISLLNEIKNRYKDYRKEGKMTFVSELSFEFYPDPKKEFKEESDFKLPLHEKFPDYNPPVDLEKWTAPKEFTDKFPLMDGHFYHSEHKYRLPGEKIFSDGKIQIKVIEGKKNIDVSVREIKPEGHKDYVGMPQSTAHLGLESFSNEEDLNEYLLSIKDKFSDVYKSVDEIVKEMFGKKEPEISEVMPESFSDCLSRNGINLEKDHHRFEVGTKIKDNVAGTTTQVQELRENDVLLSYLSALGHGEPIRFNVTYTKLIDTFKAGEISVPGFEADEKMEFARVLNAVQHCIGNDKLKMENGKLREENEKLSNRAETILEKSIQEYNKSDNEKKNRLIKIVKDQLEINKQGEDSIGFGLDKDMVSAGEKFMEYANNNPPKDKESEFTNTGTLTHSINIGDEYMWHGSEVRVNGFDDIGNVIIDEISDSYPIGTPRKLSIDSFLKEAAKFPKVKSDTDTIVDKYKNSGLNEKEAITIDAAYKMEIEGGKFPTGFNLKGIKKEMPNLLKKKLIHLDTLKFTGVIRLTDHGKSFIESLNKGNERSPDTEETISGLKTLLTLTADKDEKKKIRAEIKALKLLL